MEYTASFTQQILRVFITEVFEYQINDSPAAVMDRLKSCTGPTRPWPNEHDDPVNLTGLVQNDGSFRLKRRMGFAPAWKAR